MPKRRIYTRNDKYYDHPMPIRGGRDLSRQPKTIAPGPADETKRPPYCYAEVTVDVLRTPNIFIFYKACGRMILAGWAGVFYRDTLMEADELLGRPQSMLFLVKPEDGYQPTIEDIFIELMKYLGDPDGGGFKHDNDTRAQFEKVMNLATQYSYTDIMRALIEEFEKLFLLVT
ncbi:hypothetical protein BDV26DRAFT_298255 [Aspergillus bertholletiae]|uniref:Uncharacterized protein n=1 Tax=Aspergillus bertholletiae TaxID=1226010 RepID=A0A5N7ASJ2_9EURO|nr:hypothetical protein BDV26DRAFT_298255 [Aspergillus bertholletiae]